MKVHARLSASSAHRWMLCPGSVKLSDGVADTESPYASLGTMAHSVAAYCLSNRLRADAILEEGAEHVQLYLDYCGKDWEAGKVFIEADLTRLLERLDPALGGTADFIQYDNRTRVLRVVDFKYGTGVPVHAEGNVQLKIYALGALRLLNESGHFPMTVSVAIVQPRLADPEARIQEFVFKVGELVGLVAELKEAAAATRDVHPAIVPGTEQCRWCPAGKAKRCSKRMGYRPNKPAAGPRITAADFA